MPNEYSGRPTEGGLFCEGHREAHFHMPTHKFRLGQLVQLFPAISRNVPGGLKRVEFARHCETPVVAPLVTMRPHCLRSGRTT